jgi:acyl-CoA thioesterase-1
MKLWLFSFLIFAFSGFAQAQHILFLGDSLTEGYGLSPEFSFVSLIEQRLRKDGFTSIKVTNAGIGGSTSKSGLSRLKWHLKSKVTHLVLALGSNDALRGLPSKELELNLKETIELAQKNNLKILLLGAKVPPNYSKKLSQEYDMVYLNLVKKYKISFMPFLLINVAGYPKLNQADGIHPNEKGNEIIATNLYPYVKKLL